MFADDNEKRVLAPLPCVLDVLAAVGGGVRALTSHAEHMAAFECLLRLLLRDGMLVRRR
jgi:hypothetical protein